MTFEGEQGDMSPSKLEDVQQHVEPEYVQPAETYEDFLDEFHAQAGAAAGAGPPAGRGGY